MGKDPFEVTEAEWFAWFRQGYDVDLRALDTLKKRIEVVVVFDMSVQDGDSHIGKMSDGLAAAIRRDPLTRNKPFKKDVREYAIGHERFVGYEEETKSAAKPDLSKTNQGGMHGLCTAPTQSTAMVPQTPPGLTPANGCLKCKSASHRVREYPGITKALLLDSGADLSVVSGGLVSALLAAGAAPEITTMGPLSLRPCGADRRPVVVTKQVRFGNLEFKTGCGPLMLRGLRVWVDEAVAGVELNLGLPVMQKLGYSDKMLLENARRQQAEWDFADQSIATPVEAMHRTFCMEVTLVDDIDDDEGMCCATPDWGTDPYPTDGQVYDDPA
ncbi:hypothetical protein DYB35_010963, partial [Aphanomyces astaci]